MTFHSTATRFQTMFLKVSAESGIVTFAPAPKNHSPLPSPDPEPVFQSSSASAAAAAAAAATAASGDGAAAGALVEDGKADPAALAEDGALPPISGEPFNLTVRVSTGKDVVIPSGTDGTCLRQTRNIIAAYSPLLSPLDRVARVKLAVARECQLDVRCLCAMFCGLAVPSTVCLHELDLGKHDILQMMVFPKPLPT